MRLTVHMAEAKRNTVEVDTKDGVKMKKKTYTTLSFPNIEEKDVNKIITDLKNGSQGEPTKWYTSNETIAGFSRIKKKK